MEDNTVVRENSTTSGSGFFPAIRSKTSSSVGSDYEENSIVNGHAHSDSEYFRTIHSSTTSYSSGRESNSPTKLPSIDLGKKSSSVSSIYGSRKTSLKNTPRAEFCRSPSCPQLWTDYEDDVDSVIETAAEGNLNASIHPSMTRRRGTDNQLKLPDIYTNGEISSGSTSPRINTHRGSKTESDILTMKSPRRNSQNSTSPAMAVKLTHRQQQFQRQQSQPTALLLPMRETPRINRGKKKANKLDRRKVSESNNSCADSYKSDSGVSSNLRQSDQSAEGSEWDNDIEQEGGYYYEHDEQENNYGYAPHGEVAIDEVTQENRVGEEENRSQIGSKEKCREWLQGVGTGNRS